ncbi:transcriptional repressor [Sphingobacterium pedocola]|uniref:Fur family transcriptional regulator n=1 Tax=Sphingobacterium pedocola TaxID=2082722 RepID=A0ABR9T7G0_9SPHI|nr:transcriptional repressor [Sphingobacterium pedocola]MBE8721290.1 Fur family transcriptional regulator [Sphingobacterium pedocola]
MESMTISVQEEIHRLLQVYCTEQQLQYSKKRHIILNHILQQKDWIDAVDLWISMKRTVSVSCIYQTLRLLVSAGIVEKKVESDRTKFFRIAVKPH